MKKVLFLVAVFACQIGVSAQSIAWLNNYFPGDLSDIAVDQNGRSAVASYSTTSPINNGADNSIAFADVSGVGTGETRVIVFDANGQVEWTFCLFTRELRN